MRLISDFRNDPASAEHYDCNGIVRVRVSGGHWRGDFTSLRGFSRRGVGVSGSMGDRRWDDGSAADRVSVVPKGVLPPLRRETVGAALTTPAISVVIPAHDEAIALPHCLDALLAQDIEEAMEIILVANGCADGTASLADRYAGLTEDRGHQWFLIEIERANKSAALNAGDAVCRGSIRVFLDADVVLSPTAVSAVVKQLRAESGAHLCAPTMRVRPVKSRLVNSYVRVWSSLPYVNRQVIGCGFYAVTAQGRSRWQTFPDIISDDRFVRLHFSLSEQRVVADAFFEVSFPERFLELVRVRGRWCRGNNQVAHGYACLSANDAARAIPAILFLLSRPRLWSSGPTFLFVYLAGKCLAMQARKVGTTKWERSTTSGIRVAGSTAGTNSSGPRQ